MQPRPVWAPRVTGCPCSAHEMQSCRVLGSPVNVDIKEIITGKNCLAFMCLGLEVKGCDSSRLDILAVCVPKSVWWLSPFVLYKRLGSP